MTKLPRHHARWAAEPRREPRSGFAPLAGSLQEGLAPLEEWAGRLQSRAYDGREAYVKQYIDELGTDNWGVAGMSVTKYRAQEHGAEGK